MIQHLLLCCFFVHNAVHKKTESPVRKTLACFPPAVHDIWIRPSYKPVPGRVGHVEWSNDFCVHSLQSVLLSVSAKSTRNLQRSRWIPLKNLGQGPRWFSYIIIVLKVLGGNECRGFLYRVWWTFLTGCLLEN